MRIITLPPYGPGLSEIHVITDNIMSFYYVNYNGRKGTEIRMANGSTLLTSMDDYDLKKLLED